jgi:hypothetical protein
MPEAAGSDTGLPSNLYLRAPPGGGRSCFLSQQEGSGCFSNLIIHLACLSVIKQLEMNWP